MTNGLPFVPFNKKAVESERSVLLVPGGNVPVDGPANPFSEADLGFPAEELLAQGIVRYAIERPGGHLGMQFDPRLAVHDVENHVNGIDHVRRFHRAEVDPGSVLDPLGRPIVPSTLSST